MSARTQFIAAAILLASTAVSCAPDRAAEGSDAAVGTAGPDVDAEGARQIADGFLHAQVEAGNRPEWQDAFVNDVVTYFDSFGVVQAYEAQVVGVERHPEGWIMVEAWHVFSPVSAFATAGSSNFESLVTQYHAERASGHADATAMVPLWAGPASASLDVHEADGTVIRVAPAPELQQLEYDGARRLALARARAADGDQARDATTTSDRRRRLRELYAAGQFDAALMGAPRIGLTSTGALFRNAVVGNGASSFSPFDQEQANWNGGPECNTGCTPVALGILIEYWDRNGFPGLVGTREDNANTIHTDPDVIWMLQQLRTNMMTHCEDGQGATSPGDADRAIDHVNSRNEGHWTADTTGIDLLRWSRLKGQIDDQNPAIIHYDASGVGGFYNHSAVAYEYTDNSFVDNDWICTQKGHGFRADAASARTWHCFTRAAAGGWYQVTRVMRPAGSPAPDPTGTSARVTVAGVTPGPGEFICASGKGHLTRRAQLTGAGTYETTVPISTGLTNVDMVFWASTDAACMVDGSWRRDYWPATSPYSVNGHAVTRCVPRPENATWSFVRGTINADGTVTSSGTRACPGGEVNTGSTSVRVTVRTITPGPGEYVCAAAAGMPARRATALAGGTYEATFSYPSLPADVDAVFYASTSMTCGDDWLRDYWPATNAYSVNGTPVNLCVPRVDNATWSYVRGRVDAAGAVTNAGTRACPGGTGAGGVAARVTAAGIALGAGEYMCAVADGMPSRRAEALAGNTYVATFTFPTAAANVDTVFYASSSNTCASWLRDYWPGAAAYAVNGTAVDRCVPRTGHPEWDFVRGSIAANGTVTSTGTRPCPGTAPPAWTALAVNTTYPGSVAYAAEQRYSFTRINGRTYTVTLHPTSGDPDLYTSKFATITTLDFQCRSINSAGDDVCTFTASDSGTNYVIVKGYSAATYALRVNEQ